jgi:hypothetical protein
MKNTKRMNRLEELGNDEKHRSMDVLNRRSKEN